MGTPPQTIADLIRATGVTRTAVTEQLNELVAAGLSRTRNAAADRPRSAAPPVPGHPRRGAVVCRQSTPGRRRPSGKRSASIGGDELAHKVLKRVSRTLAEYYNSQITAKKPHERLRQLIEQLAAEGGLIEAVEDDQGQLVLCKRSCPFISMVDEERSVCYIDLEMLTAVVGRPVRQTACRHDGAPCCPFEIVEN